jgi:hypothetical protein
MFTRGSVVMLSIFLSGCAGSTVFNQQQPFVRSSDSYSSTLAKGADVGQTTGLLFFLNMQAGDLFRIRLPQDDDFRRRTFGLQNGEGLAIDRQGHLFESAGNGGPNTVTVFNRKLETIRTITIKPPDGIGAIAVDGDGLLYAYVNDTKHAVIQVFSKTASGMAKPRRKIAGNQTGLAPYALCIDAAGELIVAGEGSIEFFAPGAKGNVPPVRVLKGDQTGINMAINLAVGADGNVYVANQLPGSGDTYDILVFPTSANGNVAPLRSLQSGGYGYSIALGSGGEMYLGAGEPDENEPFAVYSPGASGNDPPIGYVGKSWTGKRKISAYRAVLQNPWFLP